MIFLFNLKCIKCKSNNVTHRKTETRRYDGGYFKTKYYDCNSCGECFAVEKYIYDSPFRSNTEWRYS